MQRKAEGFSNASRTADNLFFRKALKAKKLNTVCFPWLWRQRLNVWKERL